ncbi:hypothetical protein CC80DRAFT_208471 [Byssothecium circinans]|uniref:Uncharacterized protein n=1 Tax=Byssothecium circinans TaxID=147558 RepID=A0A6A5TFZ6_9PLEO|nr:hypothetical protein CC80DRAFT_208471 [Byssothecium circinans]
MEDGWSRGGARAVQVQAQACSVHCARGSAAILALLARSPPPHAHHRRQSVARRQTPDASRPDAVPADGHAERPAPRADAVTRMPPPRAASCEKRRPQRWACCWHCRLPARCLCLHGRTRSAPPPASIDAAHHHSPNLR